MVAFAFPFKVVNMTSGITCDNMQHKTVSKDQAKADLLVLHGLHTYFQGGKQRFHRECESRTLCLCLCWVVCGYKWTLPELAAGVKTGWWVVLKGWLLTLMRMLGHSRSNNCMAKISHVSAVTEPVSCVTGMAGYWPPSKKPCLHTSSPNMFQFCILYYFMETHCIHQRKKN